MVKAHTLYVSQVHTLYNYVSYLYTFSIIMYIQACSTVQELTVASPAARLKHISRKSYSTSGLCQQSRHWHVKVVVPSLLGFKLTRLEFFGEA